MSRGTQAAVGVRVLIVAALAGLVAGIGLALVTSPRQADLASMDQVQLSEAPDPVAAPTAESSEPPASEGAEEDSGESAQATPVDTCLRAARSADDAVAAARTSLGNWETHYGAQIAFDNGEIDGAEAKRRWAVSKEPADRNIEAFVEARDAMNGDDPCEGAQSDQLSDDELQEVRGCADRTAAAVVVMADAQPALDDWLDHLKMMATRDEYELDEYLEIWRQAVADAPAAMDTFETAVQAYEDAGDCPIERSATADPVATPVAAAATVPHRAKLAATCVLAPGRPPGTSADV